MEGGDGEQGRLSHRLKSQSNGGVYLTVLGAFEIYGMWSFALNADIKIITAVC